MARSRLRSTARSGKPRCSPPPGASLPDDREAVTPTDRDRFPLKLQFPVYAVAFFTGNLQPMTAVVLPLWALDLGASPLLIGLLISSRQFLVVTLSIHGGVLLDRFGSRKIIVVLGLVGATALALFPAFPIIWVAIILQMVSGFTESTSWIGTQALVGRLLKGRAVFAGRMTAAARTGGFIGPLVTGFAWQYLGPGGGFGFLAFWVICGVVAAGFLPVDGGGPSPSERDTRARGDTRIADVMPKLTDYATAFRLLLLPAVALVIMATFMRQTGTGIQASFYGVWLREIGFSAGMIGLLISISSAAAVVSALSIGPLTRRFADHWLLLVMIVLSIITIAITPLLGSFGLLAVAIALRGIGQGLNLPLMMSIAARAVSLDLQGRVAALRISFNRFGGALVPLAMGALAEIVGLEYAFYIIGAVGVVLIGLLALWVLLAPGFRAGMAPKSDPE